MGVDNRRRRAAKAKGRAARQAGPGQRPPGGSGGSRMGSGQGAGAAAPSGAGAEAAQARLDEAADLRRRMRQAVQFVSVEPSFAAQAAATLLDRAWTGGPRSVAAQARLALGELVATAVEAGWSPHDLGQLAARRAGAGSLGLLAGALAAHAGGFPAERVAPAWRAQIADLGLAADVDGTTAAGLTRLLALAGALFGPPRIEPLLPPPGAEPAGPSWGVVSATGEEGKQLGRVRALLAKAESTTFDAEAEALTEKAQELITKYALERLLARATTGGAAGAVTSRRIWIDAPYVRAKCNLVGAVASANRSRAISSDHLGFCTVVGEPRDIDAVELLTTSLLVQADAAMLRHGRQADARGTSRTKSFRQSFLLAFAQRIGQRLRASGQAATAAATGSTSDAADRLLPVLRATERAVEAEVSRLFPAVVSRRTAVTNGAGWAAGTAAADLARLNAHEEVKGRRAD